ncbi:hypothetical protein B0O99DRAFT_696293 [Bisporella sp. PMI_857]|nr:hypothetical protein B0O99DRAFT_696293 [Bisporella sp. PMI_857]
MTLRNGIQDLAGPSKRRHMHVGIVRAGIGGLATAISLRKAGARVTVLEAAEQLSEIGAGIQMTPNVSVLLQRWSVNKEIAAVAKQLGANIYIDSSVTCIKYQESETVTAETKKSVMYTFDLLIGADSINSITKRTLFPDVLPEPPTTNCAYCALVPYKRIRKDPVAKKLIKKLTIEVWIAENTYIITYPISAKKLFNLVLLHHRPEKLRATEPNVPIEEIRNKYKDFDPRIKRIINIIEKTVNTASRAFFQYLYYITKH